MNRFRKLATEELGTEIAETALVLPLVFFLMFATFWFGRAFNISSTLTRAANEGALAASLYSCASCGDTAASNQKIADAVESVLAPDKLNDSKLQFYSPPEICTATPAPACSTSAITATDGNNLNIKICTGVPLTCGAGVSSCGAATPPACGAGAMLGTRVSFSYAFDWLRLSYDTSGNISKMPTVTLPASAQTISEE